MRDIACIFCLFGARGDSPRSNAWETRVRLRAHHNDTLTESSYEDLTDVRDSEPSWRVEEPL